MIILQIKTSFELKQKKQRSLSIFNCNRKKGYKRLNEEEGIYYAFFDESSSYDAKRSPLLVRQDHLTKQLDENKTETSNSNKSDNINKRRKIGISERDEIERIGVLQIITINFLNEFYRKMI